MLTDERRGDESGKNFAKEKKEKKKKRKRKTRPNRPTMGPSVMKRFFTYLSIIPIYHGCRRRGIKDVTVTPFDVVQYSYFI